MSELFPRKDLSNIQYDVLIYYLSNDDGYKSYIKTSKRLRTLKHQRYNLSLTSDRKRKYNDINEQISIANAMNSLIVDSILFKAIKIS